MNPRAARRFVAYYRVSTDRQGQSGLGLEAQRKAVTDYLKGGAWDLVGEFTEIESGKTLHRGHSLVRQMLHEHAAALSAANPANRALPEMTNDSVVQKFGPMGCNDFMVTSSTVDSEHSSLLHRCSRPPYPSTPTAYLANA